MYIFLYMSISLSSGGSQPITGLLPGPKAVGSQSQSSLRFKEAGSSLPCNGGHLS